MPAKSAIESSSEIYRDAAARIAREVIASTPTGINRFNTGARHFVFEATFADHDPVVIRLTRAADRTTAEGSVELSKRLRPLGVPLPTILVDGTRAPIPYLVLERLPGHDLARTVKILSPAKLAQIASRIVSLQTIVAATGTASKYGYAVDGRDAPLSSWAAVLDENMARARDRICATRLFDLKPVEQVEDLINKFRPELNAVPAIPFLHDTTTKNVIVTADGSFSGIVDADDLCFGDPRYVAGLTMAALLSLGASTTYADCWMKHADYSDDHIFHLYVASFLVDFMGEHGHNFNDNQAHSTEAERARLLSLFQCALSRAV